MHSGSRYIIHPTLAFGGVYLDTPTFSAADSKELASSLPSLLGSRPQSVLADGQCVRLCIIMCGQDIQSAQ